MMLSSFPSFALLVARAGGGGGGGDDDAKFISQLLIACNMSWGRLGTRLSSK